MPCNAPARCWCVHRVPTSSTRRTAMALCDLTVARTRGGRRILTGRRKSWAHRLGPTRCRRASGRTPSRRKAAKSRSRGPHGKCGHQPRHLPAAIVHPCSWVLNLSICERGTASAFEEGRSATCPSDYTRAPGRARAISICPPYARGELQGAASFRFVSRIRLPKDGIGRIYPNLPELVLLRESGALRQGSNVFELGAHQGIVALILADAVGPQGTVIAVEAERHNVSLQR